MLGPDVNSKVIISGSSLKLFKNICNSNNFGTNSNVENNAYIIAIMTLLPILRIMTQHVATESVFFLENLWLYYGNLRNLNRVKKKSLINHYHITYVTFEGVLSAPFSSPVFQGFYLCGFHTWISANCFGI